MNKTVYTVLFGPYEELKTPSVITPGWKYVCITDQNLESEVWEIEKYETKMEPIRAARLFKITHLPHGLSIYVDASFTINCNLDEFVSRYHKSPFTVFDHPIRSCVYTEATACINHFRASPTDINRQRKQYRKEGLPVNNGLIQSGILIRENTEEVKQFCQLWWEQISLSTRDQIGFAWCDWKMPGIAHHVSGFDYRTSQEMIFKTHFHRRKKRA